MRFHPEYRRSLRSITPQQLAARVGAGRVALAPAPAKGSRAERIAEIRERVRDGYYESPAVMQALAMRLAG